MTALPTAATAAHPLEARARTYAQAARAPATLRAYATDWQTFTGWCQEHARTPLPATPQTLALFLADSTARPATLRRRLAAIAVMHRATGHETPTEHGMVRATFAGIRRERAIAPTQKTALLIDPLRTALATCGTRPIDLRDRALLLIGFAGALRRSELVGLAVADLRFEPDGLILRIRRSKTNQEGDVEEVPILPGSDPTTCPIQALRHWLAIAGIDEGPVFRGVDRAGRIKTGRLTARIVAERVKTLTTRCGLDPTQYGAHSLRSGFATSAARANASEAAIMRQGRWKSLPVARRYIRAGSRWHDHPAANIGL